MEGYVYVISNKGMPNYVKVGHTTRSPEERALELSGTATPFPAVVEYSVFVENARAVEHEVHRRLAKVRASKTREWFKCSRAKAIETIKASIGPAAQQEHDRVAAEEVARLRANEAKGQAEQKRRIEEAEKLLEEARKVARAAVYAKYTPRQEALARTPHFLLFWIPSSVVVIFVLAMLGVTDKPNELLPVSLFLGAIIGGIWQMRAQGQRERSSQYLALIDARDSELAAIEQRRDVQVMMASPQATATKNTRPQAQSTLISIPTNQQAKGAVTASARQPGAAAVAVTATSGQPSWLAAANAPRTAGQPRCLKKEHGAKQKVVHTGPIPIHLEQKNGTEQSKGDVSDNRPKWLAAASTPILSDTSNTGFDVAGLDDLVEPSPFSGSILRRHLRD